MKRISGISCGTLYSVRICAAHCAKKSVGVKFVNSTLVLLFTTNVCFLLYHNTGPPPKKTIWPLVDHLMKVLSANDTSAKVLSMRLFIK
jgi:hypothetical protein